MIELLKHLGCLMSAPLTDGKPRGLFLKLPFISSDITDNAPDSQAI